MGVVFLGVACYVLTSRSLIITRVMDSKTCNRCLEEVCECNRQRDFVLFCCEAAACFAGFCLLVVLFLFKSQNPYITEEISPDPGSPDNDGWDPVVPKKIQRLRKD